MDGGAASPAVLAPDARAFPPSLMLRELRQPLALSIFHSPLSALLEPSGTIPVDRTRFADPTAPALVGAALCDVEARRVIPPLPVFQLSQAILAPSSNVELQIHRMLSEETSPAPLSTLSSGFGFGFSFYLSAAADCFERPFDEFERWDAW